MRNTPRMPKLNLREARQQRKQTLEEVAAATDLDVGNLSRIERGVQLPSREVARKLFEHFGGKVDLGVIYDPDHKAAC